MYFKGNLLNKSFFFNYHKKSLSTRSIDFIKKYRHILTIKHHLISNLLLSKGGQV